jgi:hypothetical protein
MVILRGLCSLALLACLAAPALPQTTAVPSQMNFEARLTRPDGTPVPNGNVKITLRIFTAPTGGTLRYTETFNTVPVKSGNFSVLMGKTAPLSASVFNGNTFLEIQVNNDPPLTPRQPFVSIAYAFKADAVKDGSITSASIANGTITASDFAPNVLNPLAWLVGGNSGITSGFLGTTDNRPLEFRVNNRRAMRYQYAENIAGTTDFRSINVLGGANINQIAAGVAGATIAGGGEDRFTGTDGPNRVQDDFGTIGGGAFNLASDFASTVGGGYFNRAEGFRSTIAGGFDNQATGSDATIAGGSTNIATGDVATVGGGAINVAEARAATVGGGSFNTASGFHATIAGGGNNLASGPASMIPGGEENTALGSHSFAAGRRARANHNGAFVWADSNDADFASTAANQFLLRATGGFGINATSLRGDFDLRSLSGNADLYLQAGGASAGVNFGVTANQNLFIATFNGTTYTDNLTLFANGNATLRGTLTQNSDARYKTNIATFENALDHILSLRGVTYAWKEGDRAPGKQIGFLAQEVEQVLPELVATDEKGYKSVAYQNVVPVLVEAMKQQQRQLAAQQAQIEALTRRLEAMQSQQAFQRP